MEAIREALANGFEGINLSALTEESDGRITGFVVWDGFSTMQQDERQAAVWKVLRRAVPEEILINVGLILTLTDAEHKMYTQAVAA